MRDKDYYARDKAKQTQNSKKNIGLLGDILSYRDILVFKYKRASAERTKVISLSSAIWAISHKNLSAYNYSIFPKFYK